MSSAQAQVIAKAAISNCTPSFLHENLNPRQIQASSTWDTAAHEQAAESANNHTLAT